MRCTRCGRKAVDTDKFCAECGMFLRDAYIDHRLLHALWYDQEGRCRDARRELERLLDNEPGHVQANHVLGTMYFHQGTLDLAIERYETALKGAPNFILCAYDCGVAYYHRANMPEAIRCFNRCLELDPHYNAAHYRLGFSYFHLGELDRALEHYEKCTSLTPEYLMARYHIGLIHERLGDTDAAAREFQRNEDECIGEVSSLFRLAEIRKAEGKVDEAEDLLRRANEFGKSAGE